MRLPGCQEHKKEVDPYKRYMEALLVITVILIGIFSAGFLAIGWIWTPNKSIVFTNVTGLDPDQQEYLAEREAIAVYDAGLSEEQARELAYALYVHRFRPEYKRYYPLPRVSYSALASV